MKTDDWSTRRRDPSSTDETKVVRLRDWLGPEEELVPIGPRADQASQESSVDEPETGSGFWEGDPSLQTAIPAPEDRGRDVSRARARGLVRWKWLAAGLTIATLAAAIVLIVSGLSGNAPRRGQTEEAAVGGPLAPDLTKTVGRAAAVTQAAAAAQERRALRARAERQRQAAARRARARAARARQRHRAAVASDSTASVSEPTQPATTPAYTEPAASTPAPTESEPVQTAPVETTPATTPAPTSGSGGSSNGSNSSSSSSNTPAFGSGGALGPGSSPDS